MKLFSCISRLIKFAVPISCSAAIGIMANVIAMLMLARLGETVLAAGALAFPTFAALSTIVGTSMAAIGILTSHARGEGKNREALGVLGRTGIWFAILLSIPSYSGSMFICFRHYSKPIIYRNA